MMEWFEHINVLLGGLATFLGGGWIITLYNAKPKKTSIEIENLKEVIVQLQTSLKDRSEDSRSYREETQKMIDNLQMKIEALARRVDMKNKVILSAYRCNLIDEDEQCIVIRNLKDCEDCELNPHNNNNNEENKNR